MKRKQRGLGPSGEERTEPQGGWWGEGGVACRKPQRMLGVGRERSL